MRILLKTFFQDWSIRNTSSILQCRPLWRIVRSLTSPGAMNVFDRRVKRIQRNRASAVDNPEIFDYLKDTIAGQVVDRVYDVARFG